MWGHTGQKLYLKTKESMRLSMRTKFKNGSDVTKCILSEKLIKPEIPTLEDKQRAHKIRVWEYRMNELMKAEMVLEWNIYSLFMLLMSLCDSNIETQVESPNQFPELEKKMDLISY